MNAVYPKDFVEINFEFKLDDGLEDIHLPYLKALRENKEYRNTVNQMIYDLNTLNLYIVKGGKSEISVSNAFQRIALALAVGKYEFKSAFNTVIVTIVIPTDESNSSTTLIKLTT